METLKDINFFDRILGFLVLDIPVYIWLMFLGTLAFLFIFAIDVLEEVIKIRRKYNK